MSAQNYDIFIEQGADYELQIQLKNSDGTVFDLSEYTARSQIRESAQSASTQFSDLDLEITTDNKIILSVPALTSQAWNLTGAAGRDKTRWVYDVEIQQGTGGQVTRILQGYAFISPEVTK